MERFTFTIGDDEYAVRFTARARFIFEQLAGYPVTNLRLWQGVVSDEETSWLVLAGLEGDRRRQSKPQRRKPWTLDEVLDDVIGEADAAERREMVRACSEGVAAAFKGLPANEDISEGKAGTEVRGGNENSALHSALE